MCVRGLATIFHVGVTLCRSEGIYQIFTLTTFSLPVVGCLLKRLTKNGGGGGRWLVTSQDPLDMPLCVSIEQGSAVCVCVCLHVWWMAA